MANIKKFSNKYIFLGLLISLVLSFTVAPFFEENGLAAELLNILLIAALVFSVIVVSHSKTSFFIAAILSMPMLLANLEFSLHETQEFSVVAASTTVLFFTYVVLKLLKNIFTTKQVNVNLILCSICVYFLIGVVWALLFALVNMHIPGSFDLPAHIIDSAEINDFMYYSMVTLTTLGYGDITPLSAPAKSLSAMEALVGQVYLTVIVARLVGLHMKEG